MSATLLSEGTALGITYGALLLFAVVVGLALPSIVRMVKARGKDAGADFWYSARNSQTWLSLGLSFFASSMGAWVLFAAPEVGALSFWWGTFGYALASSLPFLVLCYLGPSIRQRFEGGFCLLDWVLERFGRVTQIYVGLNIIFYMWIYLVAELTSMGNLIRDFAGLDPLHALIPVSVVTMLYTMIGGLGASIWTDRVQGVMMVIFILVALIAGFSDLKINSNSWEKVNEVNDKGFETFVTLILAIFGAELFNMATWQRVYAAEDAAQLRKGLVFGVVLIFPTMILFGVSGMLAEAQSLTRDGTTLPIKALAFFDLVTAQSEWVIALTYALATCMVASSVDSLQAGLAATLMSMKQSIWHGELSPGATTAVGQLFVLLANVAAIILASEAVEDVELGFNIINLFLIADLVLLSITVPIFAGLGWLVTQVGALSGCFAGLLLIMGFGWFEFGTFMAGLEMLTLMAFGNIEPVESGLGAARTTILFFILPVVTGAVTLVVSWMERVLEVLGKVPAEDVSNERDSLANPTRAHGQVEEQI